MHFECVYQVCICKMHKRIFIVNYEIVCMLLVKTETKG